MLSCNKTVNIHYHIMGPYEDPSLEQTMLVVRVD